MKRFYRNNFKKSKILLSEEKNLHSCLFHPLESDTTIWGYFAELVIGDVFTALFSWVRNPQFPIAYNIRNKLMHPLSDNYLEAFLGRLASTEDQVSGYLRWIHVIVWRPLLLIELHPNQRGKFTFSFCESWFHLPFVFTETC